MSRWAVVGGGMMGAVAARRLGAAGADVVLYEAAPSLGGLTSAWSLTDDVVWDRFYHVILGTDRRVLALLDELGDCPVEWGVSAAACYAEGRALPASSALELIRLPFLGPLAKLRIALTVLRAGLTASGDRFDRVTSARWLRRWSGRQATERLWLPLLRAKLGRSAERASAVFIWSTIRRLVSARLEGRAADRFGFVRGGYATVLGALAERLRADGVEVRVGTPVDSVLSAGDQLEVRAAGERRSFDRVLVTAAGPLAARLCPQLGHDEQERLTAVEYLGVICPSVLLRRPVTGAYITYVTDPKPFTAVIEMTALVPPLGGHHLVYLPRYTAPDDPAFTASDEEIRAAFLPAFLEMYGVSAEDVVAFKVAKARHVMPVPTPGYTAPPVRTSVPGLFTLGSAQITVGTLNVEQTLTLLEERWPEITVGEPIAAPVA
jgi:protoporphyrinogen oxidase